MAHGHFIYVGETIGNGQFDIFMIFYDTVPFSPHVAGGLTDFAQQDRIDYNSS